MYKQRSTMLLVWIVLFTFHHASAANVFCGNDPSVVAYPDTVVNVSCWCNDSTTFVLFEGAVRDFEQAKEYLDERNITVMSYEEDDVIGYNVLVVATDFSNGTYFKCVTTICEGEDCIESLEIYIYTADGPPSPPKAPNYSVLNSTTLNISWSAPWSFPVDNYTITMFNSSSSTILDQWFTQETSVLVSKTWNSDCDLINITVEANTSVGPSGESQPNTIGFPSSLEADEIDIFAENIILTDSMANISICIKTPSICSYEMIDYIIIINSTNTSELMMSMSGKINNSETQLTIPIEDMETKAGDVLQVILKLFNIDSQTFQTYGYDFIVVLPEQTPTTTLPERTSGNNTNTSVSPVIGQQVEYILFIVAGVSGAAFGLMFCLIACTILGMFVLLFRKSKQKKQRSLNLKGSEKMEVTIPPMKSNPLYDVKPDELYDEIPNSTTMLTSLVSPVARSNEKGSYQFVYPINGQPKLPPPRKMGIPLTEAKLSQKANPVCDNETDKDDYIEMSALGSQDNVNYRKFPPRNNEPHNPSRNSMYSNIDAPSTMANFHQRYSLNLEDNNPTHYCHLQNSTNV